ncbi:MAG: tetratricopeptide repeat protein [Methylococcaceae bacterium]|nr:MAG: tetratricopeptide repeat protein [Methylococcaceae bacterium]
MVRGRHAPLRQDSVSVINQMLKDLDRRRQEQRGGYTHVLEFWERLEEDLPINRRQVLALALTLSAIAGAGLWSWKRFVHKPIAAPVVISQELVAKKPVTPPVAAQPAKSRPAPPPPVQPAVVPVTPPPAAPAVAPVAPPAEFAAKAENLTSITKPGEFAAVISPPLAVPAVPPAPQTPAAPPPSITPAPRPAESVPPVSAAQPSQPAPTPGRRATPPAPAKPPDRTEAPRPPTQTVAKAEKRAVLPPAKAPPEKNSQPLQPAVRPYRPEPTPPLPLRIRPSGTTPVNEVDEYRQAQELLAAGDFGGAMETLRIALQNAPNDARLRLALADIHVNLGQKDKAQTVLKEGLRRKPGDAQTSILYARLLAEDGDNEPALAVLNDALSVPGGSNKADLLAFAAALNQQSGRYVQAERSYRLLLQQQADNGIWLMGLAIALQNQSKNAEALEAFRQALYSGGLAPPIQRFISEQIRLLER